MAATIARIAPAEIARSLRGRIVLDPYAVLDRKAAETAGLVYYTLGRARRKARLKSDMLVISMPEHGCRGARS